MTSHIHLAVELGGVIDVSTALPLPKQRPLLPTCSCKLMRNISTLIVSIASRYLAALNCSCENVKCAKQAEVPCNNVNVAVKRNQRFLNYSSIASKVAATS